MEKDLRKLEEIYYLFLAMAGDVVFSRFHHECNVIDLYANFLDLNLQITSTANIGLAGFVMALTICFYFRRDMG